MISFSDCVNLEALQLENIINCITPKMDSLDDDLKRLCEDFESEETGKRIGMYWLKFIN